MERSAGVLLHPTSLPSPHGIGDLGPGAEHYLDWLAGAGIGWWQVLPVNAPGPGNSPYAAVSTFAGASCLVSPELLVEDGLLEPAELERDRPAFDPQRTDYPAALAWKSHLLELAFARFERAAPAVLAADYAAFEREQAGWLDDYTLFVALKAEQDERGWFEWPQELRLRQPAAMAAARERLARECRRERFAQLVFDRQWRRLRAAAAARGIRIFGDLPIFVALDSAEVWSRPELFQLDADLAPTVVAGVPPDYFSATGQLWGNPLYDWRRHAAEGYRWWLERLGRVFGWTDLVRLDHFRGFAAYWEVPAQDEVATNGRWAPGPGRALFDAIRERFGHLPLVAEDLGDITPDVVELRRALGLPGMAILQFGFSPAPRSSFIPYNHERDQVVYTGTHDNNTSVGWYRDDASEGERELVRSYAGSDGREIHWDMIRLALGSVAELAVVPHQDLLGLDSAARMNRPATWYGNWEWRLTAAQLDGATQQRLAHLVDTYGRTASRPDLAGESGEPEADVGDPTGHRE